MSKRPLVETKCLSCLEVWFSAEADVCPHCSATNVQQKNSVYRCMNCEKKFVDYSGPTTRCPNPRCRDVSGPRHPGCPDDRGIYIEWLNYEELARSNR